MNSVPAPSVPRVIFHLDMDAFYASVEQRENPRLRGQPVIVGSPPGRRGVVAAASYEARRFGVRSALPSATAGRLCPHGIFVPPRMSLYQEESRAIMRILRETGAAVEAMSIDEAYLEFTALCQGPSPPDAATHDQRLEAALPAARALQARIRTERGLTASIGIAGNKFLAKLGSGWQKPAGLTLMREEGKADFLRPLPVRAIHGVGAATEKVLAAAGIFSIGDVQQYRGDLRALAGSFGRTLRDLAWGMDDRPLALGDEIKSVSSEETFPSDTMDRPALRRSLWAQAVEIAGKLQRRGLSAQTIQVKVRYGNFETLTRQITVEDSTREARELYRLGCFLLARDRLIHRPVRLLGLGVSGLCAGEPHPGHPWHQLTLRLEPRRE